MHGSIFVAYISEKQLRTGLTKVATCNNAIH